MRRHYARRSLARKPSTGTSLRCTAALPAKLPSAQFGRDLFNLARRDAVRGFRSRFYSSFGYTLILDAGLTLANYTYPDVVGEFRTTVGFDP